MRVDAGDTPPFRSIAIVGLGLIGGSIALAVRERWPGVRIFGVDSPSVLAHVQGSGAIYRGVETIAALPVTDLLVLAAPVRQNVALLRDIPRDPPLVVTDVGGTKRSIVEAAAAQLSAPVVFVGGHPLGGGERGGFAFARRDLFTGRPWIFTPDGSASEAALPPLRAFAEGLGARVSTMSPEAHDRLMAYVSHLPQLAASALMTAVGGGVGADGLRMAGRGLLDTTRLASSPADLWRDICATNADGVGEALDLLIELLTRLRRDLAGGDALEQVFADAARWRAELTRVE